MKNRSDLGQTEFDALLMLFSNDRQQAGVKYSKLREGLVRYFTFNACSDPTTLADTTLNRIAARTERFDKEKGISIETYAYGFADRIAKEDCRKSAREVPLNGDESFVSAETQTEPDERDVECLRRCLDAFDPADKKLILDYHGVGAGQEKALMRQKMSEELNLTATAFYAKVSRLRAKLRKGIKECKQSEM